MKKRNICVLLGIGLLYTAFITGCQAEKADTSIEPVTIPHLEAEEVTVQQTVEEETSEATEEQTQIEEIGKDLEMTQNVPQLSFERGKQNWYHEDGERLLMSVSYDTIRVEGEEYEALADALESWSERKGDELIAYAQEEAQMAAVGADSEWFSFYSSNSRFDSARIDSHVVSIAEYYDDYMGGAHGYYGCAGYTFETQTGKMLFFEDIITDAEGLQTVAVDYICQKLWEEYAEGLNQDYEQTVSGMFEDTYNLIWYLSANGIEIIFNPYEVGSYAMGMAQVTLPYTEFADYIRPEYCGVSGVSVAKVGMNVPLSFTDQQGVMHTLQIRRELLTENSEYGYFEEVSYSIEIDGVSCYDGEQAYFQGAYLVTGQSGKTYLMLCMDMASDDYVMYLFDLSMGSLTETDCVGNVSFYSAVMNTQDMILETKVEVFGSYTALMSYSIDESGKLVQNGDVFTIRSEGNDWELLTTKKELPAVKDGEEVLLPIGTRLRLLGTDNQGIAFFTIAGTEENVEVHYTNGEFWGCYIDGISDMEYFEMVPYAG